MPYAARPLVSEAATFVSENLKILPKLNVKIFLDVVDSLIKLLLASTQ
jgi:hypothetical protein